MFKRGDRKAQITIFIIVGILLLFITSLILFVSNQTVSKKISDQGDIVVADVPQEFMSLNAYVENCINQIGVRSLKSLGEQGGYLNPDIVGKYSVNNPEDADGIEFGSIKIPFWYYNTIPNELKSVKYASLKPELYNDDDPELSIEAQLARALEEQISSCTAEYGNFIEQGYEIKEGENKEAEVFISDDTVKFYLQMPIEANKGSASHDFEEFYVRVPLRLKHYYEVAAELAEVEKNNSILERQALDLIATYGAVDNEAIPPTQATTFTPVPEAYWNELDVKNKMKGLLTSYVPVLRYLSSNNFHRYEYSQGAVVADLSNLYQANYDNMIIPLHTADNVDVNFDYFSWNPYLDLNDNGGVVQPTVLKQNFMKLNFNMNQYFVQYDLSYPVLVTIRDDDALNGEGFNFVFALESNIRNNVAAQGGFSETRLPIQESLVCKLNQRNSEVINTIVLDSSTLQPIDEVQVGFGIPEQQDCVMGYTNSAGLLATRYPLVYGGVSSYIKDGYLSAFYDFDTYGYEEGRVSAKEAQNVIMIHPYKTINISIKKKNVEKCIKFKSTYSFDPISTINPIAYFKEQVDFATAQVKGDKEVCFSQGLFGNADEVLFKKSPSLLDADHKWVFVDVPIKLSANEEGTIILKRVADVSKNQFNEEFVAVASVLGDNTAEIELVPGVYEVTALVRNMNGFIIPKEERCSEGIMQSFACTDIDGCCFKFDENSADEYIAGQLQWDMEKYYLTITPKQLYSANEIEFNVLGFGIDNVPEAEHIRVLEDLEVMGLLGNFSQVEREKLNPVYK